MEAPFRSSRLSRGFVLRPVEGSQRKKFLRFGGLRGREYACPLVLQPVFLASFCPHQLGSLSGRRGLSTHCVSGW